jgi:hypothetical protein
LELVAATSLLAVAIVPGLRLMRDALELSRQIETQGLLTTLCVSKLEEHLMQAGATWLETTATGTFAAEGYATLRFEVTRSHDPAGGGIADRLMTVSATVWEDENVNGVLDSGEASIVLASKLAKMERYQNAAGS